MEVAIERTAHLPLPLDSAALRQFFAIGQTISHRVDNRLHRFPNLRHASWEPDPRDVSVKAFEQRSKHFVKIDVMPGFLFIA